MTEAGVVDIVAEFPTGYFLENLVVRPDNSLLVTAVLQKELWYVPPPTSGYPVTPLHVHTFDLMCSGIVETSPDIYHVSLSDGYTTHESHLAYLDMREWSPGDPVQPRIVYTFDNRVRALNGACELVPGVLLLADCFAGLTWRVRLTEGGLAADVDVWLAHETMAPDPDATFTPPQPGINGIRVDSAAGFVHYTNTARELFVRIAYDPKTLDPVGEPETTSAAPMSDDFCIDSEGGFAFVAAHRHNTLERMSLVPGEHRSVVVGVPFDESFVGPSSAAWGRRKGDRGRSMFVTTDGGTTATPPDGRLRSAKVVRVTLPA